LPISGEVAAESVFDVTPEVPAATSRFIGLFDGARPAAARKSA
jgi:hypothetical protein